MARSKVAGKATERGAGSDGAWRVVQAGAVGMALIEAVEGAYVLRSDASNGVMNFALALFLGLIAWGTFQRARWSAWVGGLVAGLMGFFTLVIEFGGPLQIESTVTYTPPIERVLQPIFALLCGAFLVGLILLRRARK